jgi:photosystem II stability/assembly factor-like uncharacterized protein
MHWSEMPKLSRITLCGFLALFAVPASPSASSQSRTPTAVFKWRPLKVGAGGFLTGLDISPDGKVKLVRADTYGAYAWDPSLRQWRQLVTAQSMPASDQVLHDNPGVYEIRVAPSDPERFYMAFDGFVYRSDNAGRSWRRTQLPRTAMDPNDPFRTNGQKMAVDPASPDRVLVGTAERGLFLTEDGGRHWTRIVEPPPGEATPERGHPGIAGIAFDSHSAQMSGRTATVYAASYGHGVYRSQDGGVTWARLEGGPRNVTHARVARDGAYYAVGDDGAAVWRHDGSGWSDITPDEGRGARQKGAWSAVVTDPSHADRILIARDGGSLAISSDRGKTWRRRGEHGRMVRVARDVPWLAWTEERYMSVGDMALDPTHPDRLWFAEGIGVWRTSVDAESDGDPSLVYASRSAGIEQLVANQIIAPPGGKPLLASWDRPVFRIDDPNRYPSRHGPNNDHAIVMGWALDYAASEPNYVAGLFNWWGVEASAFSRDGGRTWTPLPSYPPLTSAGKIGGSLAVSSPLNLVWAPSNNGRPYYTRDGGATWLPADVPGVPTSGDTGWGFAYFLNRHIVAADRVAPGTFYLYNTPRGLYRSTDSGASWTLVHPGEIAPWSGANAELLTMPGQAGRLFFTSGPQGGAKDFHPARNPLMRSVDGGKTWTPVPGVLEVHSIGFGKGTGAYPAILIVGWVRGRYGVWRSEDDAATWTPVGEPPLGILNPIGAISGDGDDPTQVYVGFRGAGYAIFGEDDAPALPH